MQQSYQTIPRDTSEKIEPATHHNFGFKVDRRLTIIMAAVLFLLFVTTGYLSNFLVTVQSDCLGPPYLYISHQDSHNILKYSRDGCPLSKNVLWFGNTADPAPGWSGAERIPADAALRGDHGRPRRGDRPRPSAGRGRHTVRGGGEVKTARPLHVAILLIAAWSDASAQRAIQPRTRPPASTSTM